jgi:hypothetical protein
VNVLKHAVTYPLQSSKDLNTLVVKIGNMTPSSPDSLATYNAEMHYEDTEALQLWHLNKSNSSLAIGNYVTQQMNMRVEYHL